MWLTIRVIRGKAACTAIAGHAYNSGKKKTEKNI